MRAHDAQLAHQLEGLFGLREQKFVVVGTILFGIEQIIADS